MTTNTNPFENQTIPNPLVSERTIPPVILRQENPPQALPSPNSEPLPQNNTAQNLPQPFNSSPLPQTTNKDSPKKAKCRMIFAHFRNNEDIMVNIMEDNIPEEKVNQIHNALNVISVPKNKKRKAPEVPNDENTINVNEIVKEIFTIQTTLGEKWRNIPTEELYQKYSINVGFFEKFQTKYNGLIREGLKELEKCDANANLNKFLQAIHFGYYIFTINAGYEKNNSGFQSIEELYRSIGNGCDKKHYREIRLKIYKEFVKNPPIIFLFFGLVDEIRSCFYYSTNLEKILKLQIGIRKHFKGKNKSDWKRLGEFTDFIADIIPPIFK